VSFFSPDPRWRALFNSPEFSDFFLSILPVSNLHAFERFHMGIALFALTGLFKNLSTTPPAVPAAKRHLGRIHPLWAVRTHTCALSEQAAVKPATRLPGLRVVRIQDSDAAGKVTGRLVISGRMADVCAELDRLVAMEASHQLR